MKTGRKPKSMETRDAEGSLHSSLKNAIRLVTDLVGGQRKRVSQMRYNAAIFNIEQCLGKSRIKVEHSGEVQTSYSDLARSAESALKDAGFNIIKDTPEDKQ